ncbi:hypothetical protein KSF78_0006968 [Schistosoma japonicum]|nr:hypothetical protein KSF78_0006968 [Schistosoma japonicum]
MQKRMLFEANSINPFLRCHISGASNISLVKSNILCSQVVKLSTSQQPTYLEFMYEKMCSRILYRFMILRTFISNEQDFRFDLRFSTNERRPFIFSFSTKVDSLIMKRFTVMVPLSSVLRSVWVDLTIDLFSFIHDLNVHPVLRKLQSITVYPFCFLSELSVTSSSIGDVSIYDNSQTIENNASLVHQVLNVPKVRLNEWKGKELLNLHHGEDSKMSNLNTADDQSCAKTSHPSSLEVQKSVLGKQDPGRKRISLKVNRVCINEQSTPSFKKVNTDSDPRSFSAGAISNRLANTAKNYTTSLLYYPEGNDGSNQLDAVNSVKLKSKYHHRQHGLEKHCQSIRLGSLYLFNSLPQPAPNFLTQSYINDMETKDIDDLENKDVLICSKSSYLQRISIDHHSLKKLSDTDLKFKVILASSAYHLNNENSLSKRHGSMETSDSSLSSLGSHKSNVGGNNIINEVCTPPPIDLAGYERSDDLSASFEASLLASLKQAAMGGTVVPDLQILTTSEKQQLTLVSHNNKSSETTVTPMINAKVSCSSLLKSIPVPSQSPPINYLKMNIVNSIENEQCDIVNTLRKQILNVSFSDSDDHYAGDDTTTTDGLGSLIYLRYHLARHHHHHHSQRCEYNDQSRVHEKYGGDSSLNNNHQKSPKSEASTYHSDYTMRNEDNHSILTPSRASSLIRHRTHSSEDVSQLVTGVELSSHWGTGTANSSDESISYSVCESITSSFFESNHLSNNTFYVNHQINSRNSTVQETKMSNNKLCDVNSTNELIELIYDPILNCYYDPKSGRFYELT